LAKAWISASEDPSVSTDQTGESFHLKVARTYWKMAKEFVNAKKEGYETVSLKRAQTFPKSQFNRI